MRKIGKILGIIERNWEFLVKIWEKLGGVWVKLDKFEINWGGFWKIFNLNIILGNIWLKKTKLRYIFIEISIVSMFYILFIYAKKIILYVLKPLKHSDIIKFEWLEII